MTIYRFVLTCGISALIVQASFGLAYGATVFDLSDDFSLTRNPGSVWQYGYSATKSLAPDQFQLDRYVVKSVPVGFWHPASGTQAVPGYYPYVAHNSTTHSQTDPTKGWVVRPGEVAMEASNSGQYSLIRFVAPAAGTYKVTAHFEGVHFHLSSTDVHVLHNADSLFYADIDGYGGDPAFHVLQGTHPAASYSGTVRLKAKDTLTFAVGYGKNKTHFNDTTGLFARVTLLSSSMVMPARPVKRSPAG